MPLSNRITLSLAGTAAVALASLPLGITPASAAKVSEGTTSSIGVVVTSPNAQQFNLGSLGVQDASTGLVARRVVGGTRGLPPFLQQLLNYLFGVPGAGWTPGMPGMIK